MTNIEKRGGPQLACEITPDRVIVARTADKGTALDSYTSRAFGAGVLNPRLTDENILNSGTMKQAITDAFTTVGARSRDIVAILPDASVRIALLDFETLPEKRADADGVIRFRLKKAVPFDIEKASVSYDVFQADGKVRVLTAVMLSSVLAEYEAIFRELGYAPGVVIPSSLAALGNVDSAEPVMVIKSDASTTTLAIVADQKLLLFRTLENTGGISATGEQLIEDVHASLVFFQDTYNMQVQRILLGGSIDSDRVAPYLESQANVRVQNLVVDERLGGTRPNFPASTLAGVVGALLG